MKRLRNSSSKTADIDARSGGMFYSPKTLSLLFGLWFLISLSDFNQFMRTTHRAYYPGDSIQKLTDKSKNQKMVQPMQKDIITKNSKVYIHVLDPKRQGWGAMSVYAFFWGLYFQKAQNRTLVIDERILKVYRWNKSVGMYEGYFDTKFHSLHPDELPFNLKNATACRNHVHGLKNPDHCQVLHGSVLRHGKKSRKAATNATREYFGDSLHDEMVEYVCQQMPRLTDAAQQGVNELLQGLPAPNEFAVAFHVRRAADKLPEMKDIIFPGKRYIQTFLKANPEAARTAKNCFVAADIPESVNEIDLALKEFNIPCKLWTLSDDDLVTVDNRDDRQGFLKFLAQFQIMVQADTFVGQFTSNVGTMATILRGCPSWTAQRNSYVSKDHYHQSYAIDLDVVPIPTKAAYDLQQGNEEAR